MSQFDFISKFDISSLNPAAGGLKVMSQANITAINQSECVCHGNHLTKYNNPITAQIKQCSFTIRVQWTVLNCVMLPNFFARFLHPKDLLIGAISLAVTLTVFGVAQSHKPQLAKIKRQYPLLVPVAVLGSAVLVVHALASILVFLWGFIMPLAGMLPLYQ